MIIVATTQNSHARHKALNGVIAAATTLEPAALRYGDYCWTSCEGRTVGMEVSSWIDVLGKLASRRLVEQATGLAATYDRSIWLLHSPLRERHGKLRLPQGGTFSAKTFRSVVMALADTGVTPWFVKDDAAVAQAILQWHELHQQPPKLFRRTYHMPEALEAIDERIDWLRRCPPRLRLGEKTMETALRHFGSVRAVVNASAADLRQLPGWGPKRSQQFEEFVTQCASSS